MECWRSAMKTIQMTFNEDLLAEVDRIVKELGTTRSAFTRRALKIAINELKENEFKRCNVGWESLDQRNHFFEILWSFLCLN